MTLMAFFNYYLKTLHIFLTDLQFRYIEKTCGSNHIWPQCFSHKCLQFTYVLHVITAQKYYDFSTFYFITTTNFSVSIGNLLEHIEQREVMHGCKKYFLV